MSKTKFFNWLLIVAVAVLAHLPALRGDFHFDDFHHIVNNPSVKTFPGYFYFFNHPEAFSLFGKATLYRPLTLLSFALNYRLCGKNVAGWLIFNIFLHALNAGFVFLILRKWLSKNRAALFGGLMFSVMPILSQPVNYVSNRATLLASFFIFAGLLFHDWSKQDYIALKFFRLLLSLLCFWLALFSKEIAVAFPALVLLSDFIRERFKQDRFRIFANVIYWLNFGIFLLFRYKMFGVLGSQYYPRGFWENANVQSQAVWFYLYKVFFPVHLSILPQFNWSLSYASFFIIMVLVFCLGAVFLKNLAPGLALGYLWFIVSLIPSSLIPLNVLVSEERVYLGTAGLVLGLVWLIEQALLSRGCLAISLYIIIFICHLTLLELRIPVWRNEFSLWRDAIRKSPELSGAYVMYGNAFIQASDLERASEIYERALYYDMRNPQALDGMCQVYLRRREPERLKDFAKRYEEYSVHPHQRSEAVAYQSFAEFLQKDFSEAESLAKRSLEINPNQAFALYVLGSVYYSKDDLGKAEEYARRALRGNADLANANELLGLVLGKEGRMEEAVSYLKRYTELSPEQEEGWLNLGMAYLEMGRIEQARIAFEESLRINADYARGYYGMAMVELTSGNADKALDALEKAIRVSPEDVNYHFTKLWILIKGLEDGYFQNGKNREKTIQDAWQEIRWLKSQKQDVKTFENRLKRIGK